MESRPTPVFILVALVIVAALGAGAIVAQLELEKDMEAPELVEKPDLPDWANTPLPDFSQFGAGSERKEAFFGFLFPRIALANLEILRQRRGVKALQQEDTLSEEQEQWLEGLADRLRIDRDDSDFFDRLLKRLDIIPPSLMMAQAANESSWGTSRFATRGNNLFGQWCFSKGCGIVPGQRSEGMNHEVARYKHPYASIRSYMTNLNRHNAYSRLRTIRRQQRQRDQFPTGISLAGGLELYSERGSEYVREIRSMIRFNNLDDYDARLRAMVDADSPRETLRQEIADYRQRQGD